MCRVKGQMNLLFKFGHRKSSKTCPSASDKNQMLLARVLLKSAFPKQLGCRLEYAVRTLDHK